MNLISVEEIFCEKKCTCTEYGDEKHSVYHI